MVPIDTRFFKAVSTILKSDSQTVSFTVAKQNA